MKSLYRIALIAFIAFCCCGSAAALEILYPADGTYVTKSSYLIIKGGTDPYLSGFTVEINGVKSDLIDVTSDAYRAVFADMLILEPIFDSGNNRIVVEGFLGKDRMATVDATVYYLESYDQVAPASFKQEVFHLPEREQPCLACHNMNPTPADLVNPDPRLNACGSCHVRMLNRKHVHGPAGVFECTYCHQSDSQPSKYQARPGDADLCVECHEDKLNEYLKSKFVHGPIEAGLCMVCHDPHASDQPSQLVMPAYDLCSSCHDKVGKEPHVTRGSSGQLHPLKGVTNPAGNGEDLSCASCHNPHSANVSAMFRWGVTSRMNLCAKCHQK